MMKLTGNFYIAAAIELIAEGMTMGERAGLSRETLLEYYSYMFPGAIAGLSTLLSLQAPTLTILGFLMLTFLLCSMCCRDVVHHIHTATVCVPRRSNCLCHTIQLRASRMLAAPISLLACDTGPIFEGYGGRIAKDQFDITQETPGMTTTLAMKDVRHIRDLAKDSKVCVHTSSRRSGCKHAFWSVGAHELRSRARQMHRK